jgi:putative FmdB family regulatory protein
MPIYEYSCHACGQVFEHLLLPSRAETLEVSCPHCRGTEVERMMSAFAVSSEGIRDANLQRAKAAHRPIAREKRVSEDAQQQRIADEHN